MSTLDPTVVQQLPNAEAAYHTDVGDAVVEYLTTLPPNYPKMHTAVAQYFPEVAKDHESRIVFGEKKYGQRLKINNGRDALTDAYQECADALSYLMQTYLETHEEDYLDLFYAVASISVIVRKKLIINKGTK